MAARVVSVRICPKVTSTLKPNTVSIPASSSGPTSARDVDPRLGGEEGLRELVSTAHAHGIRILQDYVINHVHEDHEYFLEHPEWFRWVRLNKARKETVPKGMKAMLKPSGEVAVRVALAVPLFPTFVAIGAIYHRRADALDESFRDLIRDE